MKKTASTYFEQWDPKKFNENVQYQITIRSFLEGKVTGDVLDLGCGSRVFYDLVGAKSWTGIDISSSMLSGISFFNKIGDMRIIQGDMLKMQLADESADTVIAMFVLHHLAKKNIKETKKRVKLAFAEAIRVLRPGGRFIVCENCRGPLEHPYHWMFPISFRVFKKALDVDLPYFWQRKHYLKFAQDSGFKMPFTYVQVPMTDWVYNPVLKCKVPPLLTHDLIQRMTIFEFKK